MVNVMPSRLGRRRPPPRDRIVVLFTPELGRQVRNLAEQEQRPLSTQIQVLVQRGMKPATAAAEAVA